MKDESSEKIMTEFVGLRENTYSKGKKEKGTKKCVIKRKLKFGNYRNCLERTQLDNEE